MVDERTKLVYLSNPANPTGSYATGEEIRRLHAGLCLFPATGGCALPSRKQTAVRPATPASASLRAVRRPRASLA